MGSGRIGMEIDQGVATLTMTRADKLNAMDGAMFAAIGDGFRSLGRDPSVRAILLAGDRVQVGETTILFEPPTRAAFAEKDTGELAGTLVEELLPRVGADAAIYSAATSLISATSEAMVLRRCADLPEAVRGTVEARIGVFGKAPKPIQERRMDLPTIGVSTVRRAAKAGLAGIVGEAGGVLVVDRAAVIAEADELGIFIYGAPPPAGHA